jgi:hypothetical protein
VPTQEVPATRAATAVRARVTLTARAGDRTAAAQELGAALFECLPQTTAQRHNCGPAGDAAFDRAMTSEGLLGNHGVPLPIRVQVVEVAVRPAPSPDLISGWQHVQLATFPHGRGSVPDGVIDRVDRPGHVVL